MNWFQDSRLYPCGFASVYRIGKWIIELFAVASSRKLYTHMHGLTFEARIWLLAGSTRFHSHMQLQFEWYWNLYIRIYVSSINNDTFIHDVLSLIRIAVSRNISMCTTRVLANVCHSEFWLCLVCSKRACNVHAFTLQIRALKEYIKYHVHFGQPMCTLWCPIHWSQHIQTQPASNCNPTTYEVIV